MDRNKIYDDSLDEKDKVFLDLAQSLGDTYIDRSKSHKKRLLEAEKVGIRAKGIRKIIEEAGELQTQIDYIQSQKELTLTSQQKIEAIIATNMISYLEDLTLEEHQRFQELIEKYPDRTKLYYGWQDFLDLSKNLALALYLYHYPHYDITNYDKDSLQYWLEQFELAQILSDESRNLQELPSSLRKNYAYIIHVDFKDARFDPVKNDDLEDVYLPAQVYPPQVEFLVSDDKFIVYDTSTNFVQKGIESNFRARVLRKERKRVK